MTAPATFHLVCGSTGAGKTTLALRLVQEVGALHFSIDDWMVRLFGADQPPPPDWPWIAEHLSRCWILIVEMAAEAGRRGFLWFSISASSVPTSAERIAQQARAAGLSVRLRFIDVTAGERWRQVSRRNDAQSETYRVTVTRPMFDFIRSIWQAPSPDEMAALDGARGFAVSRKCRKSTFRQFPLMT